MNPDAVHAACASAVHELITKHDWRLLDEDDFIVQLTARLEEPGNMDQQTVTAAAVNHYCEIWYEACASTGERRQRAYTELAHYLYDRALHRYGDTGAAREIAHDAIVLVAEQLDRCRNPGAFMAFALLKLWNAATAYFRRRNRQSERTTPLLSETEPVGLQLPGNPPVISPEDAAVSAEQAEAVLARLGELMQRAPRARRQFEAVVLKFLYAYSDDEIAEALETDVANVYVLRSRGLKLLRADPVLQRLWVEG